MARLPKSERDKWIASLSDDQVRAFAYDWRAWGRPEQLAPASDFRIFLYLGGRGTGKTRAGCEWVREKVAQGYRRIGLLSPTASDVRDVLVEGTSGILSVFPPSQRPVYEPSKRRLTFKSGAIATTYSADEPERLRGPQHDALLIDELAAMRNARTAYDMAMFGLRLGADPQAMVTTTPKPISLLREIMDSPYTAVSRGSTWDNKANLAGAFFEQIISKYENTRLGEQEIMGRLLDDLPGSLFSREMIRYKTLV